MQHEQQGRHFSAVITLLQTTQAEQTDWKKDLLEEGKLYCHKLVLG